MTIRVGIIGFGKIAHDEHWPTIRDNPAFELAAVAGGSKAVPDGVQRFGDHRALIGEMGNELDAVAICTPPDPRHAIARDCLAAGLDVMLEKPPAATLGELNDLVDFARTAERTLYAAWHSQHAPAVIPAAAALKGKRIRTFAIEWRENIRRWHPGQDWVLGPGGFGVLDAGINALSIVTRIVETPLLVQSARLVTPANRQSPIAVDLNFVQPDWNAVFDWRAESRECRTIRIETDDGVMMEITDGGTAMTIDGQEQRLVQRGEYAPMYGRFAVLIGARASEVDAEPLRIVADAYLVGTRETTEAFDWVE